jgi:hypothetical protein
MGFIGIYGRRGSTAPRVSLEARRGWREGDIFSSMWATTVARFSFSACKLMGMSFPIYFHFGERFGEKSALQIALQAFFFAFSVRRFI